MRIHLGQSSYLATADKNKDERERDDVYYDAPVRKTPLDHKKNIVCDEAKEPLETV